MVTLLDTPESLIATLTENLAVHRADAPAIWRELPKAYQEVAGVPLDRADLRQIMICQCVVQRLTITV